MSRTILITGATGAIGPHIVAELLRRDDVGRVCALVRRGSQFVRRSDALQMAVGDLIPTHESPRVGLERLHLIAGNIGEPGLGLSDGERSHLLHDVEVIVHAAAKTRFTAGWAALHAVNVNGSQHLLEFGHRAQQLQQFLFVSTACVAGTSTGIIRETIGASAPRFVNAYERSKWEAEQLVVTSGLPVRIARLSTCLGGEATGYVHRFGAIHRVLGWLARGLIPMIPAVPDSRVDLISTDFAARWLACASARPVDGVDVCHVAAGARAVPLQEMVDCAVAHLRNCLTGWRHRQILPPVLVDADTYRLLERSVARSGDALMQQVLEAAAAFLPSTLYPKIYETQRAEAVWGGPMPRLDWRATVGKVIGFGTQCAWRRNRWQGALHV